MSDRERRQFERIRVNHTAMVRVHGTDTVMQSAVVDLSGGGIRLRIPQTIGTDTALAITMTSAESGEKIVASCHVVRVQVDAQGGCEVACTFD